MKKVLRSIQTLFPIFHDTRYTCAFFLMKINKKPHENDFNALKMFRPNNEDVFLDIGSNRGEGILSMLVQTNLNNNIIGFEPNALIFDRLKKYFSKNNRVLVHNVGLSDKNEELVLYVPFYRKWMFDGLSSFRYEFANDWLKTRLWRYDEKKFKIKTFVCQLQKLDDFNLNPYFIKIDVQGFEKQVLKGGFNTIKTHRPILLIETIDDSAVKFLEQFDYKFYKFINGEIVDGKGRLNTFCITPEKYAALNIN